MTDCEMYDALLDALLYRVFILTDEEERFITLHQEQCTGVHSDAYFERLYGLEPGTFPEYVRKFSDQILQEILERYFD